MFLCECPTKTSQFVLNFELSCITVSYKNNQCMLGIFIFSKGVRPNQLFFDITHYWGSSLLVIVSFNNKLNYIGKRQCMAKRGTAANTTTQDRQRQDISPPAQSRWCDWASLLTPTPPGDFFCASSIIPNMERPQGTGEKTKEALQKTLGNL